MKNILITLPGFINLPEGQNNHSINLKIIDLINEYPQYFYDGIKIECVYDSFPCIWGGGRAIPGRGEISNEEIWTTLKPFFDRKIKVRFNFTNTLLREEHLTDKNANNILKQSLKLGELYNQRIGIVIYSELLEKYLREKYSHIDFIYSTTLGQLGLDEINKRTKNNLLVLDYMYNNDFNFLNQLQYPDHIEVLANEACIPNCPHRKLHFDIYSAIQLGRIQPKQNGIPANCWSKEINSPYKVEDIQIDINNFINNYLPIGINRLKLVGRCVSPEDLIDIYLTWMVKPNYHSLIKEKIYEN